MNLQRLSWANRHTGTTAIAFFTINYRADYALYTQWEMYRAIFTYLATTSTQGIFFRQTARVQLNFCIPGLLLRRLF